jgi:Ser/Thr protein kinase RdoA (MazF antagonist)
VAYRVGRRAVVADRGRWVKVVRPSRLADLVAAHARLDSALGPIGVETPRVLAQADDGRLELSTVSGESLHRFLRTYGPQARPATNGEGPIEQALAEVARGLAALHGLPVEGHAPPDPSVSTDSVQRAIDWVARVEPATVDRLRSVAATLPQPPGGGPTSMIHGDLHDKNVFVGSDGRVGLIDLDGVGLGSSIDDVANLAVHLELRAMQAGLDRSIGRTWSRCLTDAYARLRPLDADDLGIRRRHTWFRLAYLYRFRRPGRELTDRLLALAVDDR